MINDLVALIKGIVTPSSGSGMSAFATTWLEGALSPTNLSLLMYPAISGLSLPTQMIGTFAGMVRTGGTAAPMLVAPSLGHLPAGVGRPLPLMAPAGGLGPAAGMGRANAVGPLSVPPSWAGAAGPQAAMLGRLPMTAPLAEMMATPLSAAADAGIGAAALGAAPLMMAGLPRAVAAGAVGGVVAGGAANFVPRLSVVPRSPAAGYTPVAESLQIPAYPAPATFPAPVAGYTPAIVYLPNTGQAPALG